MATRNLLEKDFKLVRQPGQTVTYPVNVPDPLEGDDQGASQFGPDSLPEDGSITTEECLIYGGTPINGQCTLTRTVNNFGNIYTITSTYRIVD